MKTHTQSRALQTRLDAQRQTVLRLPIMTRWFLFLTVWSCLTFGGIVLMASWLVPAPAQAAARGHSQAMVSVAPAIGR